MHAPVQERRGFALPIALVVLVVLAVSLTGAFSFVTSERRIIQNLTMQEEAFALAQSGLEMFATDRGAFGFNSLPPDPLETVEIELERGRAEVVLERVRVGDDENPSLYVIRSTGIVEGGRPQDPDARRTVAQFAQWQPGTMRVRAGWTSLTGLHKNGAAGTISGVDLCGEADPVAGVSVPGVPGPGMTTSGPFSPTGVPPLETFGGVQEQIDELGFDWDGIRNRTAINPDVIIPGDAWPSFANPNYWPVIHMTGNHSLPTSGRGILIVTGSLTINGASTWEGIIMAGRNVTGNGNNSVLGATLSGLDAMLADDPDAWVAANGVNSTGNGTKTYQYDSCRVARALAAFGGLRVMENAWMDNWPVL